VILQRTGSCPMNAITLDFLQDVNNIIDKISNYKNKEWEYVQRWMKI
jgi:hypothetical protein